MLQTSRTKQMKGRWSQHIIKNWDQFVKRFANFLIDIIINYLTSRRKMNFGEGYKVAASDRGYSLHRGLTQHFLYIKYKEKLEMILVQQWSFQIKEQSTVCQDCYKKAVTTSGINVHLVILVPSRWYLKKERKIFCFDLQKYCRNVRRFRLFQALVLKHIMMFLLA